LVKDIPMIIHLQFGFSQFISFREETGQLEPNLTGMFLGWSSTNFLFFVPVGYSTWLPGPIICYINSTYSLSESILRLDFINSNTYFMLHLSKIFKIWLEPNLAGMFLGWSSTNFLFFVPVGYSTWLLGPIICSDWLKFQRSSSCRSRHFEFHTGTKNVNFVEDHPMNIHV
jgi:hypothetical protein